MRIRTNAHTPARARRVTTTGGALGAMLLIATTAAGCTLGGGAVPTPTAPTAPAEPSASATPGTSTPPAPTDPTVPPTEEPGTPETFTTQIDNATFMVPAGWTVRDESAALPNHDNQLQWMNEVHLVDEEGRDLLLYIDGAVDATGDPLSEWGIIEQRPIVQAIPDDSGWPTAAAAWWVDAGHGVESFVEVTQISGEAAPLGIFPAGDRRLAHFTADLTLLEPCADIVDRADAVACLESPEVAELMTVLASLEQREVPWDAMP